MNNYPALSNNYRKFHPKNGETGPYTGSFCPIPPELSAKEGNEVFIRVKYYNLCKGSSSLGNCFPPVL